MPDIFDQLTQDFPQQEGDIFDQIAPDSDESSSSRGASSISAPRSPVAAQNATSAGANPAAGSTAFAPQPSSQAEMLGPLAAPGSALPNVAPAALAQGVSAQNKPPVRRPPAQKTIAPPVQQQRRVVQQPQTPPATKQAPASASNAIQQPNWRYIAEHPELPEYRSLYQLALSHLSPEEKREIVNKRIAAYPEKQKAAQQPAKAAAQTSTTIGAVTDGPAKQPPSDSFRYARYADYQDKGYFDDPQTYFPDPVQKGIMRAVYSQPEPESLRIAREKAEQAKAKQGYWDSIRGIVTPEENQYRLLARQYENQLQDQIDTERYRRAEAVGNGDKELAKINQEREDDAMAQLQAEKILSYPIEHPFKATAEIFSPIGDPVEASGIKGYPKYFKGLYQTATASTKEESYKHGREAAEGLAETLNPLLYSEAGVKPQNIVKYLLAQKLAGGTAQFIAEKIGASPEAQEFVSTISGLLGGVGLGLHERLSAAGRIRATQDFIRKNADLVERLYAENEDFQTAVDRENWRAAADILNPFLEARIRLKSKIQGRAGGAENGRAQTNAPAKRFTHRNSSAVQVEAPVGLAHKTQVHSNTAGQEKGAEVQGPVPSSDPSSDASGNSAAQNPGTSAPSSQLAAIASRSDIPPAQKHELMASAIVGELTPQTEASAPAQAGRGGSAPIKAEDEPVAVMQRYMEANGELPPGAESKAPPRTQVSLDPERIAPIGHDLATLSHDDRQGVLINLHDKLSQAIFDRGKILGPDGQLHVVSSPAEAAKLAQQIINDSIKEHDERAAERQENANGQEPGFDFVRRGTRLPSAAASETSRASSSEEAARINPNFRLDATNANLMQVKVVGRQGRIPPYVRLDHIAYQVIAKIRGKPFDGLNVSLERAQEIIGKIREQAASEPSRLIREKLNGLAKTLTEISSKEDGLSMVRRTGSAQADFKTIQEELFHSVVQRRPGKGKIAAGTPHEALASDPTLQKMQPRIQEETGSTDPTVLVIEGIHDIWSNESRELSSDEQYAVAEKYWEELANKAGIEALRDLPQLWDYFQHIANEYNVNTKEVMNDRAYQALQRVIARRTRAQSETLQRADRPTSARIPLQHRGREETQGDPGESQEPEGQPGTGREDEVERPSTTGQSVFLSNGRKATIQYISAAMKVARVRLADGRTRTVKLSEIQESQAGAPPPRREQTRLASGTPGPALPIADTRSVPAMGHAMTAESPAVRRVKAESHPVGGQEPTVKVKQEPTKTQAVLSQPPAPVRPEEASRIGHRDPQSGRTILQPSNDLIQNERLASQAAPELDTQLSRIAESVPGAKFDRLRPQKGLERLQEKVADGKPPRTIGDNLAAQIVAPNPEAKDQLIARMQQEFPVVGVDDKFLQPREKAGYPSANVQVQTPNGSTAEVQIVAPEIQAITDQTHGLYTKGRNFPEGSAERTHYWDQAAAMHTQALEKFRARNAQEQSVAQLAPGQRVVLKSGQTGKIVGFSKKFGRITVRTSKGLKTVKVEDVRSRVELKPRGRVTADPPRRTD